MTRWRRRVDDLLYDGETVEEAVDFEEASVVVTTHRVLAFDGESEGPTLQQAERPNVETVSTGANSEMDLLARGVKAGVIGLVLVGAGFVVDFGSIIGDVNLNAETARRVGMGEIMGTMQSLLNFMTQLDYLMQVFGALAVFMSVVFFGVYWLTRDPTLVVEVAGDDDLHLPRPAEATEVAERIERAILPETPEQDVEGSPATDPVSEA